ncbi:MAG: pantetheine-phosphate adenylyltransferase [Bacteroidetes bacterium]|nr:pantetheine-phosphate adenylyltransferase [Bacteroidota bacterium]
MKKIALYPGSFDPFTVGHLSIVNRALSLFDEVIVAIGVNISKKEFMTLDIKVKAINELFSDQPRVRILCYDGLTAQFCEDNDINFVIRGVRDADDFMYERRIANINKLLNKELETVLYFSESRYAEISSSMVREVYSYNGKISTFVPPIILKYIK